MKNILLLLAALIPASGVASAATLFVSASGQFSSSDAADSLVAPNGFFSLSFDVSSTAIPVAGTVTSLGFDVPISSFLYTLNNVPVSVTPSEIRFNTLANGGLFDVTIGTGLSSSEFDFEGTQAFSGTTAAPLFSVGRYTLSNFTYSDPSNYDFETPGSQAATISPAPEPSTMLLIPGGLIAALINRMRRRSTRQAFPKRKQIVRIL